MTSIIRMLPALAAAFMIGALMASPGFGQTTTTVKSTQAGIVIGAAVLATLFLIRMTHRKPQGQQQSYSQSAPSRRFGR